MIMMGRQSSRINDICKNKLSTYIYANIRRYKYLNKNIHQPIYLYVQI